MEGLLEQDENMCDNMSRTDSTTEGCAKEKEDVKKLYESVEGVLDRMENLVWWTCSESQKTSWQVLLAEVRDSIKDLQKALEKAQEENQGLIEDLNRCVQELEMMRKQQQQRQQKGTTTLLPPWVPDVERNECKTCKNVFSLFSRRHHCRSCGDIFCGSCCNQFVPVPHWGYDYPVRVCSGCYTSSNEKKAMTLAELHASTLEGTTKSAVPVKQGLVPKPLSFLEEIKKSGDSGKLLLKTSSSRSVKSTGSGPVAVIDELREQMLRRRSQIQGSSPDRSPSALKQKLKKLDDSSSPCTSPKPEMVLKTKIKDAHVNSSFAA